MRTTLFTPLVGVAILLLNIHGYHCTKEKDPMLAEESANYVNRVSYDRPTDSDRQLLRSYIDLLQGRSSSPSSSSSSSSSSNAYHQHSMVPMVSAKTTNSNVFSKPLQKLSDSSSESGEIFAKAASEYWNYEEPSGGGGGGSGESPMEEHGGGSYGGGDGGGGGGYEPEQPMDGGYLNSQNGYHKGKEINIVPDHKPITLHYRTHSQPIVVHQTRVPGPKPEVKHTTSHEEPHRVVHEVIRPIIQEVHEIIQPYRRVVQQVQPVIEEVRTVIAKDAGKGVGGGYNGGNKHGGGGGGGRNIGYGNQHSESKRNSKYSKVSSIYQQSPSETHKSLALPGSKYYRGKVYVNKKGVPVYQSQYVGPAYYASS